MKLKLTRPDGSVAEVEGTPEECAAFVKSVSPIPEPKVEEVKTAPAEPFVWIDPNIRFVPVPMPYPVYPVPMYPYPYQVYPYWQGPTWISLDHVISVSDRIEVGDPHPWSGPGVTLSGDAGISIQPTDFPVTSGSFVVTGDVQSSFTA